MRNATDTPARRRVVLMYHAIADAAGAVPDGQDAHYTVDLARFGDHLDALAAHGGGTSARDWLAAPSAATPITFDDGHVSNFTHALPALLRQAMRADFFVNPANVGRRGFASWAQLREMAGAGMSIQSHGWDHRYFTELDATRLREDLVRSRAAIEDALGAPVTLVAPPGGRMPRGFAAIARECGYAHVLSSRPGRASAAAPVTLPRMAVTAAADVATLEAWLRGRGIAAARLRYAALGLAKRAFGDRRYERLRARLLRRDGTPT
ncbi:MAG TPA: polysaccharide deacetylase family protein [Dokdonella sp.]